MGTPPRREHDLRLRFAPLTAERWADFEDLFGSRGACGGCWCMWSRLPRKAYEAGKGESNRRAMRRIVESGPPPGILAYDRDRAVGWCAFAPRAEYARFATSRSLAPVDDLPVWSVSCFFVRREYRRRGVTRALLEAAAAEARKRGAKILEGYPVEPKEWAVAATSFAWTGFPSPYLAAGFREVLRRTPNRPILRREL